MTTKRTVYPSDRATKILGTSATRLNQTIEVFADAVAHHTVNLNHYDRKFWNFFADVLNGFWANETYRMRHSLAAEFEDAEILEGKARKWEITKKEHSDLIDFLKEDASDFDAWAIIFAVQFFWDNYENIDMTKHEWWTIPFRLEFKK